ncbi:hypothetical protein CR513_11818, partial [Mucuna pruriens]
MKEDSTVCYDIESKIFNSRQGTLSVTEYYETLNGGRIFKFLHALNFEYDPIRVQILGKEKLPSLSEEKVLQKDQPPKKTTKSSHGEYCTYCKRSGHTKDTCYKRYGKEKVLERMGGNKGSTQMWVNQTTSNKENGVEHRSTSQLDQDIQAFISQSIWILDSRAIDHMTSFPSHFTSYLKVPKRQLITIANRDHVPIAGSGNVQLHSSLSLHNELTTGRTIGIAKEQ